ncbi:ferroporti-1, partial [Kipferlia bialata]
YLVPILLSSATESLTYVALYSMVREAACLVFNPFVGAKVAAATRLSAFRTMLIVQNVCVVINSLCLYGLVVDTAHASLFYTWIVVLLASGSLERVAGAAASISVGKDFVLQCVTAACKEERERERDSGGVGEGGSSVVGRDGEVEGDIDSRKGESVGVDVEGSAEDVKVEAAEKGKQEVGEADVDGEGRAESDCVAGDCANSEEPPCVVDATEGERERQAERDARTLTTQLANANRSIRSLDMGSAMLAPLCASVLLTVLSQGQVVTILCLWNVGSFFGEYIPVHQLSTRLMPSLNRRQDGTDTKTQGEGETKPPRPAPVSFVSSLHRGWTLFYSLPCAAASLSLSLLYLSCLSPSNSLLLAYLSSEGVQPVAIASMNALASCAGLVGVVVTPIAISRFGVIRAGRGGITWQGVSLCLCLYLLVVYGTSSYIALAVALIALSFSRVGLWLFDSCVYQTMQTAVPPTSVSLVNGVSASVNSLCSIGLYATALTLNSVSQFVNLACASLCVVGLAFIMYMVYSVKELKAQRDSVDVSKDVYI